MGGIIPRNTKIKVIRQWLNGLTRDEIAKKNDIGAGTVTGIIQEARKEEEYNDIDLLREVSKKLKEEELALPSLGFAIRLRRIREDNEIKEDQIEPIIQEFAICRLRQNTSYDTLIQIGREALYLEQKFGVPIEKIPEYIVHGKQTIDRIEDQRQEKLGQIQLAGDELTKLEKYRKEIPSIQCIKELGNELEETRRMNKLHEISERVLTKERDDAWRDVMRLNADLIESDTENKNLARQLFICRNNLYKLSEKSTNTSKNSG